jgi:hypothetical protein
MRFEAQMHTLLDAADTPLDVTPSSGAPQAAANSRRVPTLFRTNASWNRFASALIARKPVQCVGTR